MKKTSKIMLALGYLGGVAMALNFRKGKKKLLTTEDYAKEFVDLHKQAFNYIADKYLTDDVKASLDDKKKEVLEHVAAFRVEALAKFDELKTEGKGFVDNGEVELKKLYDNRADYLEKAKELGKDYLETGKKYLAEEYEDLKKKIK